MMAGQRLLTERKTGLEPAPYALLGTALVRVGGVSPGVSHSDTPGTTGDMRTSPAHAEIDGRRDVGMHYR
jgi:hypothetical protein